MKNLNVPDNSPKNLANDPSFQLARPQVGQDVSFESFPVVAGKIFRYLGLKSRFAKLRRARMQKILQTFDDKQDFK